MEKKSAAERTDIGIKLEDRWVVHLAIMQNRSRGRGRIRDISPELTRLLGDKNAALLRIVFERRCARFRETGTRIYQTGDIRGSINHRFDDWINGIGAFRDGERFGFYDPRGKRFSEIALLRDSCEIWFFLLALFHPWIREGSPNIFQYSNELQIFQLCHFSGAMINSTQKRMQASKVDERAKWKPSTNHFRAENSRDNEGAIDASRIGPQFRTLCSRSRPRDQR